MRESLLKLLENMSPGDDLEKMQIADAKSWLSSECEIYRIERPAKPDKHLVSYSVLIDLTHQKILLVDHKIAGLWLAAGGHVERDEHPKDTAARELEEELAIQADFLLEEPFFLTVAKTTGQVSHTDVSLWYLFKGDYRHPIEFDKREFNGAKWFAFDEIPYERSDPYMGRFIKKIKKQLAAQDLTRISYEVSAESYAESVLQLHPKEGVKFREMLPVSAQILDLGCGPGRDAKIFSEMGLNVVGVDFSPNMIKLATQTAKEAQFYVMDVEQLKFPKASYDGVWANCSLLHTPKKKILKVLLDIHAILKDEGVLYISVKEGKGEKIEKDQRYGGIEKFWSFFQKEELQTWLLEAGFVIRELFVEEASTSYHSHPLIKVFAKKANSSCV